MSSVLGIDGYSDATVIGRGGFSTVYRVYQDRFDRVVALKVLSVDVRDARSRRRFEREQAVTGRLGSHPNIVTVFDSGFTADGNPYIAMEYLAGGSLADQILRDGPLTVEEALRIGVKIAGALETAHRQDVLHRDIKPENVLMSEYREPLLADFGFSILRDRDASQTSEAFTTKQAPPEVLEGRGATAASDVYSLGSTLYTLLAGREPYGREGDEGVLSLMLRIARDPVPPIARADVPPALFELLEQAMAKDADERFASAQALGSALRTVQQMIGVTPTDLPVIDTIAPPGAPPKPVPEPGAPPDAARDDVEAPTADSTRVVDRGGADRDDPTRIHARRRATAEKPLEAAPERRIPRALVIGAIALAGILAALAVFAFAIGGAGDNESANQSKGSTTAAPKTETTVPAARPATGLTAVRDGSRVLMSWEDTNPGFYSYAVVASAGDRPGEPLIAKQRTTYVVSAAEAAGSLCFFVFTMTDANVDHWVISERACAR